MQSFVRRLSVTKDDASAQQSPRPSATQNENELALRDMCDMQRIQLEAARTELDELRTENEALKDELESVKSELEVERMPPAIRRLHGVAPKEPAAVQAADVVDQSIVSAELEQLRAQLHQLQSKLSESQERERSTAAQLRNLAKDNADLRADLDQAAIALDNAAVSVEHLPAPVNETLANQNAALRARVVELEEQVEEKQEHLAETALLVEKMFSEFSTLQVEFLALKSKSTAVPGDALDVAALHAALDCKDKQLESAASDMARMAMDFADLGEQLQLSKIERMQLQVLCADVMQELDVASRQWDAAIRSMLQDKYNRENQAAAAKYSEMVDGLAPILIGKHSATRSQ